MAEPQVPGPSSVAAAETTSPTPLSATASRDGPSSSTRTLGWTRRPSAQERIHDILETARSRAASIRSTSGPGSPRMQPLLHNSGNVSPARILEEQDPTSEDEHQPGLVMRGPSPRQPPDYQTLTTSGTAASRTSLRSRRPTRGSRRSSGNQPRPGRDGAADDGAREDAEDGEKWWLRIIKNFKSIELENKGSVARDHLALERTFLAWLRTSLAFASIGIAITQLFRLNTSLSDDSGNAMLRSLGRPLGITFLAISIVILFLGFRRYFDSQQYIMKGKFPASRGTIIFVSFIAFAVTVASLAVIVAVHAT